MIDNLFTRAFFTLAALCFLLTPVCADDHPSVIDRSVKLNLLFNKMELPDGAAWDGRQTLYVPDVKGKQLYVFNTAKPDTEPRVRLKDIAISGTCFQNGKLYLSDNPGSRLLTLGKTGTPEVLCQFDPKNRPNDLTVDANGNVYVTITREGVIRKVTPTGEQSVLIDGLVTPNGIAISPSGRTLYVSSAKTGRLSKIDLTSDQPQATQFAQLAETDDGFRGDGMATDRAGNVYCTGAKSVTVWNPSGKLVDELITPDRPINVIVGGATGRQIFLSTFGGVYAGQVKQYGVLPNPVVESDQPTSTKIPDDIVAELNVVYSTIGDRELLMDVFRPSKELDSKLGRKAIIVVHGGGWLKGDKTKFRALALRLAESGYVTAAIEYRLGFEAPFPAAIRDCNEATAFLRQNATRLGIDPNKIAAVGGSAGGHLVGLMAAANENPELQHTGRSQKPDARLQAAVVMAGPLEIASGQVAEKSIKTPALSNAWHWIGGNVNEKRKLYQLADAYEQISNSTPPMLFLAGSKDNPARNAKSRQKLIELGIGTDIVVHKNATHGHWNRSDWIEQVVTDIDTFLNDVL